MDLWLKKKKEFPGHQHFFSNPLNYLRLQDNFLGVCPGRDSIVYRKKLVSLEVTMEIRVKF